MTTTVYHLPNSRASSAESGWDTTPRNPSAYHTTPVCRYVSEKIDVLHSTTVEKAERRGLKPCSACVEDDDPDTTWQPQQCPVCGEDSEVQLATHIRKYCTGK